MSSQQKHLPKPPPTALNKETIGIWNGWGNLGDREVVREAATKGSHIKLAITFLAQRKRQSLEQTETWFKNEVFSWVLQLLERKQIFRASHILKNNGANSDVEFTKIFQTTCNEDLRDYIGTHLMKNEQLSEGLQNLWKFLHIIRQNSDLLEKQLEENSIRCLDETTDHWKAECATILFLQTKDEALFPYLSGDSLWNLLILKNDIKNITTWIKIRHSLSAQNENPLHKIFERFPITNQMINSLYEFNLPDESLQKILDTFSKYGIFGDIEKTNLMVIIQRFLKSGSISNLYEILGQKSSVLNVDAFNKLLVDYCLEHDLFHVLFVCLQRFDIDPNTSSVILKLIRDCRCLAKNCNLPNLVSNIVATSNVLSDDSVSYFSENPLIFLALLMFSQKSDVPTLVKQSSPLILNGLILNDLLVSLLENNHTLQVICERKTTPTICKLTVYDLLDRHAEIDSKQMFPFRAQNIECPSFTSKELAMFGYSKKIDYNIYLKHMRPCFAAKMFIMDCLQKDGLVSEERLQNAKEKVYKLAMNNFHCDQTVVCCISFLEMIGIDSLPLRVMYNSARIIYDFNQNMESTLDLIFAPKDPIAVQNLLESIILKPSENGLTGLQFTEFVERNKILMRFSQIHDIKQPEVFLKYCASRNLWLPFLLFAQIYNYPLEQLKLLVQFFKSPNIMEHLTHGITVDLEDDIVERSLSRSVSLNNNHSDNNSEFCEIDLTNIKATLVQTLIRCHNSTDPPKALLQACQFYRAPLLAIFATSYEPDSVITNWLTWLAVSCDLCQPFTNFETVAYSPSSVSDLLVECLKNGFSKTVHESFTIFLPDNPLKIFCELLSQAIQLDYNEKTVKSYLETFVTLLRNTRKLSIFSETDEELTYLSNRVWIETTALKLLAATLHHNFQSLHEQICFAQLLNSIQICDFFTIDVPNFSNLVAMLKTLQNHNIRFRYDVAIYFDAKQSRQATISCINELLERQMYRAALEIANIEALPPDLILMKEWQSKLEHRGDLHFWKECNETFMRFKMTADCACDFYTDCAEKIRDSFEKFTVFKYAWEWADKFELSYQYDLEKKMWLAFFELDDRRFDLLKMDSKKYLYAELLASLNQVPAHTGELNSELLEESMNFALDHGNFWLALKLQQMFGCKCADLDILKLCHSLAEDLLQPQDLNTEQRMLLSNTKHFNKPHGNRRIFSSRRLSTLSSYSHASTSSLIQADLPEPTSNDTLTSLKILTERLKHGIDIGLRIFMTYRISINTEVPYHVVTSTVEYKPLLKSALDDDCSNKLDVIHDFIKVFQWTKDEIADFLCEALISAISAAITSNCETVFLWDLDANEDFPQILQLLQDNCSLLGRKIYSYLNAIHKAQIETDSRFKTSEFCLITELLIKAHDCFTADCNMDGISFVLKKSKEVVSNLLTMKKWKLIVRLLTGISRYTEMKYVFKVLLDKDQFEFLLRKQFRKDNNLKMALLDFLNRSCPDNQELYKIVALHFTLFSEVAVLWEREAENVIRNLISIARLEMQNDKRNPDEEPFVLFQNTDGTRICLNKAKKNYVHATDFHLEGQKYKMAMNSTRQAELIALQLGRLSEIPQKASTECLFHLTVDQINCLISTKFSLFEQSQLLVEAYNLKPDWSNVLYQQYIVANNLVYLEGFLQHLNLSDTLVYDISRKFVASNSKCLNEISRLKHVLRLLRSPYTKYRIASELGFSDLVEDLIESDQVVYLKDTVWKKGYKGS